MSGKYKNKVIITLINYIFNKDSNSDIIEHLKEHGLYNIDLEKILEDTSDSDDTDLESQDLSQDIFEDDTFEVAGGAMDDNYLKGSIFYRGGNYSSESSQNSDEITIIDDEITGGKLIADAGSPIKEFKKLDLTNCECSTAVMDDIKNHPYKYNDSCLPMTIEEKIIDIVDEEDLIKISDKCDGSEKCLIKNLIANTDIIKEIPELHDIEKMAFKPKGPNGPEDWLNDKQLDHIMHMFYNEFNEKPVLIDDKEVLTTFTPCSFAMSDFYSYDSALKKVNILDVIDGKQKFSHSLSKLLPRKSNVFGCIINTDKHTGSGIHWIAVYVDCRSDIKEIGYFNSVQNKPPKDIEIWMEKMKEQLQTRYDKVSINYVNTVGHQNGNNQCGMYSLYFIRTILLGKGIKYWYGYRIPDSECREVREYLFTKH
jgi:hypothetical protein